MREVLDRRGVRVYEDTLAPPQLARLRRWADQVTYRGVHADGWRPVWRLGDGEPLRGPTWSVGADPSEEQAAEAPVPTALHPLAEVVRALLLVGDDARARVSLTPWVYPRGTGLGLHRDDGRFGGSYVYYFGPEWDVHWGGLLNCVVEPPTDADGARAVFDPTDERRSLHAAVGGLWIAPAPNRLVVLAPHVRHFISRVEADAGDRARLSIGGFVHRPGGPHRGPTPRPG